MYYFFALYDAKSLYTVIHRLKCLQHLYLNTSKQPNFPHSPKIISFTVILYNEESWMMRGIVSWVKREQLDLTCFIISLFNAQHVSDVNTSILRSLRLICWVISCGDVVSVCRLKQCLSLHTDTTPPQSNHNVTPTHIEPEQYNPWNNSTNKLQAPEDGCINIRNMLSIK